MRTLLAALLFLSPAAAWAQSDATKSAGALCNEASRLEGDREHLKAIEKYRKAVDKAVADQRKDIAARALAGIARCNESLVPENLPEAQAAWARIVAEFGDQAEIARVADEKVKCKGVDVLIRRFAETVKDWRDRSRSNLGALDEKRAEAQGRILPLEAGAVHGLLTGLSHSDELVRAFVAETLAEVIDEAGIASLVSRLGQKDSTPGAALALNKVFGKWSAAKAIEDQAVGIQEDLDKVRIDTLPAQAEYITKPGFQEAVERNRSIMIRSPGDKIMVQGKDIILTKEDIDAAKQFIAQLDELKRGYESIVKSHDEAKRNNEKNLERATQLSAKAKEIRRNIPASLNSQEIQAAFGALIGSDAADPLARLEACKSLAAIGDLNGDLVTAVLAALATPDRNVRRAAAVAAGAVDTTRNEDKLKLVERLMVMVTSVAETDGDRMDPANDAMVREASAESLGRIGVVRAIPSLVAALSDPFGPVRERANLALITITGRDFGYESEPLVSDPNIKDPGTRMSEDDKRKKQIALRQEAIGRWNAWWTETGGAITLVERFYRLAANWKAGDPARLFDRESYLKEVKSQSYAYSDPADALARATRTVDRFIKAKDFLLQDAVDAGAGIAEKLLKYLGGTIESDPRKIAAAPTRMFVAEALAKISAKEGGSGLAGRLRDLVSGGSSAAERAGAALSLGSLPKDSVGSEDRDALKRALTSGDAEVRESAARALAVIGDAGCGDALADLAADTAGQSTQAGVKAAIAALRALAAIKPKGADVVRKLADLVGHEPDAGQSSKKSSDDLVREYACDALGEIAEPSSLVGGLIRARRDGNRNVRIAAARALASVLGSNAAAADSVVQVLKDPKYKSDDRRGAALSLGVAGPGVLPVLVYTLVDENPPLLMADSDSAVRAAVAEALGELGDKAKVKMVGEALLQAMERDLGEEVRRQAYGALRAIGGNEVPVYDPVGTAESRGSAVERIRSWLSAQGWRDQT